MENCKRYHFWRWHLVIFLVSIIASACWSSVISFYSDYDNIVGFMANGILLGICFAFIIIMIDVVERFIKRRLWGIAHAKGGHVGK